MFRYGLSISRLTLLLLIAICVACKPAGPPQLDAATKAVGPMVRATVVAIRTTQTPESRTVAHALVIVGDRARDTSEQDVWRLFDTRANTVTFVDDVARTFRTESLKTLIAQRRAITTKALPAHYPRARLVRFGTKRTILGVTAELIAIESGAYKRELWIAEHRAIPRGLFAMMHASNPPTLPLAPMMSDVDEAFIEMRGFPLADRAEVPVSGATLIVDRAVVSIAPKEVPEALITIPKGFRDLTQKKR